MPAKRNTAAANAAGANHHRPPPPTSSSLTVSGADAISHRVPQEQAVARRRIATVIGLPAHEIPNAVATLLGQYQQTNTPRPSGALEVEEDGSSDFPSPNDNNNNSSSNGVVVLSEADAIAVVHHMTALFTRLEEIIAEGGNPLPFLALLQLLSESFGSYAATEEAWREAFTSPADDEAAAAAVDDLLLSLERIFKAVFLQRCLRHPTLDDVTSAACTPQQKYCSFMCESADCVAVGELLVIVGIVCSIDGALKDRCGAMFMVPIREALVQHTKKVTELGEPLYSFTSLRALNTILIHLINGSRENKTRLPSWAFVCDALGSSSDIFFQVQCVEILFRIARPDPRVIDEWRHRCANDRVRSVVLSSRLKALLPTDPTMLFQAMAELVERLNLDGVPKREQTVVAIPAKSITIGADGNDITDIFKIYFTPNSFTVLLSGAGADNITVPYTCIRSVKVRHDNCFAFKLNLAPARVREHVLVDTAGCECIAMEVSSTAAKTFKSSPVQKWILDALERRQLMSTANRKLQQQQQKEMLKAAAAAAEGEQSAKRGRGTTGAAVKGRRSSAAVAPPPVEAASPAAAAEVDAPSPGNDDNDDASPLQEEEEEDCIGYNPPQNDADGDDDANSPEEAQVHQQEQAEDDMDTDPQLRMAIQAMATPQQQHLHGNGNGAKKGGGKKHIGNEAPLALAAVVPSIQAPPPSTAMRLEYSQSPMTTVQHDAAAVKGNMLGRKRGQQTAVTADGDAVERVAGKKAQRGGASPSDSNSTKVAKQHYIEEMMVPSPEPGLKQFGSGSPMGGPLNTKKGRRVEGHADNNGGGNNNGNTLMSYARAHGGTEEIRRQDEDEEEEEDDGDAGMIAVPPPPKGRGGAKATGVVAPPPPPTPRLSIPTTKKRKGAAPTPQEDEGDDDADALPKSRITNRHRDTTSAVASNDGLVPPPTSSAVTSSSSCISANPPYRMRVVEYGNDDDEDDDDSNIHDITAAAAASPSSPANDNRRSDRISEKNQDDDDDDQQDADNAANGTSDIAAGVVTGSKNGTTAAPASTIEAALASLVRLTQQQTGGAAARTTSKGAPSAAAAAAASSSALAEELREVIIDKVNRLRTDATAVITACVGGIQTSVNAVRRENADRLKQFNAMVREGIDAALQTEQDIAGRVEAALDELNTQLVGIRQDTTETVKDQITFMELASRQSLNTVQDASRQQLAGIKQRVDASMRAMTDAINATAADGAAAPENPMALLKRFLSQQLEEQMNAAPPPAPMGGGGANTIVF